MPIETSDTVLMVDPEYFATVRFETDIDNRSFQRKVGVKGKAIQALAKEEFYEMVNFIRAQNIKVIILKSPKDTPDAVFTNDWLSTHIIDGDPYVFIYPMYAESRRKEVQIKELLTALKDNTGISYKVKDFRGDHSKALEGNASLVFDNRMKKIFLSRSNRADESIAKQVADTLGYELICFTAYDHTDNPVFQTTQMLSIGEELIFVCSEAIKCEKEREAVITALTESGKTIIDVSIGQIFLRCCNSLEVKNKQGKNYLIISAMADLGFTKEQKEAIDKHCTRLPCNVKTIEDLGGGTARCMVAEILKP